MNNYFIENKPSQFAGINEKRDAPYNPLVSIVTPVLNGIKYLEKCIQSVLKQSYPYIEHIIVDGVSTDGTLDVLARYHAEYPDRIKYISERDEWLGEALNKGIKLASGRIYGWIDSDDKYESDAIMAVVEFFRTNRDAYFLFGGCNMINEKDEKIGSFTIKDFDLKEALNNWHYIVFCSAFYRREVVEKVGFVNTWANDLDFYVRVYKKLKMHRIDKVLAKWRLHPEGISLSQGKKQMKKKRERLRQDFILCLKNGGNPFSPRCIRFYLSEFTPMINFLRPVLGWCYPFINKRLGKYMSKRSEASYTLLVEK